MSISHPAATAADRAGRPLPGFQATSTTKAPHSPEAELSTLGGLILDNRAWPDVSAIVQRNDFHEEKNRIIFSAIRDLAAAGKPFDPVTLIDELERNG
ncbi:MAG TPA: DnaB-like helicase N-terminal domain-containing protein, partial [Candidatus Competibacteraceae bacterium]|nr:DnaB-like helicase N-terminal domain-containing protein [Candidatus Competibacteraceae bacterium]